MTDKQFEKIKKGLQFHSEGGIDNLCTMTETTLRTIIEDATKEMEKENVILKKEVQWLDMAINYDFPIADKLAELEAENQKWKDEWQEQVQKATDEGYARTLQTMQLTKAKDIIREVVEWATWQGSNCPNFKSIQDKAEQFLSEVEK